MKKIDKNFMKIKKLLIGTLLCFCFGELFANTAEVTGVDRYGIYIGSNIGGKNNQPLLYAGTDAVSFQNTMSDIGGISKGNSILLLDPTKDKVDEALNHITNLIEENRTNSKRSEFVFYYSGHSDENALLLGKTTYSYSDLKAAISEVPSDVHVVILDSCYSGNFIRTKGGSKQKPFLVDDASVVKGHAYLSSSSSVESSQESDEIGSSFFTNAMITGLRGAADSSGDKKVTLNELYSYAFNETLSKTENTSVGPQHPNYNITLVGSGDLVLSDISNSDCIVVLDKSLQGRIIIRDINGKLVSEVNKTSDKPVYLALEEGPYTVTVTNSSKALQGGFTLRGKNTYVLDESSLLPVALGQHRVRGTENSSTEQTESTEQVQNSEYEDLYSTDSEVYIPCQISIFWNEFHIPRHHRHISSNLALGVYGAYMFEVTGIMASSIYNVADHVDGIQAAGIINIANKADDFQCAGIGNIAYEDFRGFQGAGIFNYCGGNLTGTQYASICNIAKNVKGSQIGLVNIASEVDGIQFGLVNISKNGVCEFGAAYSDENNLRVTFNTGCNRLYGIFGTCIPEKAWLTDVDPIDKNVESIIGIGSRIRAGVLNLDFEVLGNQVYFATKKTEHRNFHIQTLWYPTIRTSLGISPVPCLMIYGGAMLSFEFDGNRKIFENKKNYLTFATPQNEVVFHPEFELGVRFCLSGR